MPIETATRPFSRVPLRPGRGNPQRMSMRRLLRVLAVMLSITLPTFQADYGPPRPQSGFAPGRHAQGRSGSVFGDSRVDLVGPSSDSTFDAFHIFEALFAQKAEGFHRSNPAFAVDVILNVGI